MHCIDYKYQCVNINIASGYLICLHKYEYVHIM